MQIWVDADACPRAVKEILFRPPGHKVCFALTEGRQTDYASEVAELMQLQPFQDHHEAIVTPLTEFRGVFCAHRIAPDPSTMSRLPARLTSIQTGPS